MNVYDREVRELRRRMKEESCDIPLHPHVAEITPPWLKKRHLWLLVIVFCDSKRNPHHNPSHFSLCIYPCRKPGNVFYFIFWTKRKRAVFHFLLLSLLFSDFGYNVGSSLYCVLGGFWILSVNKERGGG